MVRSQSAWSIDPARQSRLFEMIGESPGSPLGRATRIETRKAILEAVRAHGAAGRWAIAQNESEGSEAAYVQRQEYREDL